MNEKKSDVKRELVLPGEVVDTSGLRPGVGTYAEDGTVYAAQLGIKNISKNYINVFPLNGRYIPRYGDKVIGIITEAGASSWLVDINSPYPAPLHVNDVPWKVEFGNTPAYLKVGDTVLVKIDGVDEAKHVRVSMKEQGLRKLSGGSLIEIPASKVPRVIGKGGSMINLLKEYTGCRVFVGQNGRIWIDGDVDGIALAVRAIKKIDEEAQTIGLTDKIREFLEKESENIRRN